MKTKTEKRYLQVNNFNRCFILKEIEKLLRKDNATILIHKGYNNTIYKYHLGLQNYFVGNGFTEISQEAKNKLDKCYKTGFYSYYYYGGLNFILNGYYYYLSLNDNVFMGGTMAKIKVNDFCYYKHRIYTGLNSLDEHDKKNITGMRSLLAGLVIIALKHIQKAN